MNLNRLNGIQKHPSMHIKTDKGFKLMACLMTLMLLLTSCGHSAKADQAADKILEHINDVNSYRLEASVAMGGHATSFTQIVDQQNHLTQFKQTLKNDQTVDVIRTDYQDYASVDDGEHYLPVDRQTIGVLDYRTLCGILVPRGYQFTKDHHLIYEGSDKQVFESIRQAFSLSFTDQEVKHYVMNIRVEPSEDGKAISYANIRINHKKDESSNVDIKFSMTQINSIDPIIVPDQKPTESSSQ